MKTLFAVLMLMSGIASADGYYNPYNPYNFQPQQYRDTSPQVILPQNDGSYWTPQGYIMRDGGGQYLLPDGSRAIPNGSGGYQMWNSR